MAQSGKVASHIEATDGCKEVNEMTAGRAWGIVLVFFVLLGALVYDAHVENRGLRQLVFGWMGDTLMDMRWRECQNDRKAICN